ncbi:MAG: 3-oxoacyl-[acyl-carrier-protein] synthase III C-terminal domain-containing protein, partial [Caldimonas sp.]
HVLSVCVEVSSAAMYLDNDPGVLISACLFGDGAGAAVLSRAPAATGRRIEWTDSASLIEPGQRKALMFEQRDGMLRNILTREVPALAADYARRVLETVLGRAGLNGGDIAAWIMHAGGRDVLLALERRFELDHDAFRYSAAMLREYGNLSSAFVYFVLEAALADDAPGGWWWLSSFGAGFSCHGALLRVD